MLSCLIITFDACVHAWSTSVRRTYALVVIGAGVAVGVGVGVVCGWIGSVVQW